MSHDPDEVMALGLCWMTGGIDDDGYRIGAMTTSDYTDKIHALDAKVKAKGEEIFHWQLEKYSPSGILSLGETDNPLVTAEQEFYKQWQSFASDWSSRHTRLIAALADPLGGADTPSSEVAAEIDGFISSDRSRLATFTTEFDKIQTAHATALAHGEHPEKARKPFPWLKIALIGAGLVGAYFLLKYMGKRAEKKALALELEESASGPQATRTPPALPATPAWRKAVDAIRSGRNPLKPQPPPLVSVKPGPAPPMPPMYVTASAVPGTQRNLVTFGGAPYTLMDGIKQAKRLGPASGGPKTVRDTAPPPTAPFSAPPTMVQG